MSSISSSSAVSAKILSKIDMSLKKELLYYKKMYPVVQAIFKGTLPDARKNYSQEIRVYKHFDQICDYENCVSIINDLALLEKSTLVLETLDLYEKNTVPVLIEKALAKFERDSRLVHSYLDPDVPYSVWEKTFPEIEHAAVNTLFPPDKPYYKKNNPALRCSCLGYLIIGTILAALFSYVYMTKKSWFN